MLNMTVVLLMLAVTACYTISATSDKYAVSTAKFTGNEVTLLICSSMSVFLALSLPFQDVYFTVSWQAFAAILLVTASKLLEIQMAALVLEQLSAFELKAWLGVTLFASYITDVLYGAELRMLKLICIAVTIAGLVFIARSGKDGKIDYRKIAVPLVLYLISRYGYGLVIKAFTPYSSPTLQLLPAMVLITIIMLFRIRPSDIIKKNRSGAVKVVLARIPNTIGILLENIVISISLANYSFIQPMILVTLFFIGILRKEHCSKINLAGSIICMAGVIAFQLL